MNPLSGNRPMGEEQTCLDVLFLQNRIFSEYCLRRVTRSEQSQNVLNRNPHVSNNWLALKYVRSYGDAGQKVGIGGHEFTSLSGSGFSD